MSETTRSSATVVPFTGTRTSPTRRKGDPLTAKKLALLERISQDKKRISPPAFRLAFVLVTKFLNRVTEEAQVDQETLGSLIGLSSRWVRRMLEELTSAGYLRVIKPHRAHPGGRAIRNRYKFIFETGNGKAPPETVAIGDDAPPKVYAFHGRVVRVSQEDFDRWRDAYRDVPDMRASLQACDDYLSQQTDQGNWFFRASAWLKKENDKHATARAAREKERQSW